MKDKALIHLIAKLFLELAGERHAPFRVQIAVEMSYWVTHFPFRWFFGCKDTIFPTFPHFLPPKKLIYFSTEIVDNFVYFLFTILLTICGPAERKSVDKRLFAIFWCFSTENEHSIFLFTIFADYRECVDYGNGAKQPD